MQIEHFPIEGVLLIAPVKRSDSRGFFSEVYDRAELEITDVNTVYMERGLFRSKLWGGFARLDTGTSDSLLAAADFATLEGG
jgi:dTDP-4-dehydrorhamnose 3,5-epimerase-like enzyme